MVGLFAHSSILTDAGRVWNAKYNLEYDELLVSCSSDSFVNLWDVTDISSSSKVSKQGAVPKKDDEDWLIKTYEDHDITRSVYSVAWGCGKDPFVFASLSYDQSSYAVVSTRIIARIQPLLTREDFPSTKERHREDSL